MTELMKQTEQIETTEAMREITLQQTMSRTDYSALRTYYMYRIHPNRMRNMVIALILSAILAAVGRAGYLPDLLYWLGICGLFFLTFFFIWIDDQAKKLEKPGKSIGNRPQTVTLSETGFRVEWLNYGKPLDYAWESVILAVETDLHLFLFVKKLAAIVIPKRGVKPEKLAAVITLIESKRQLVKSFGKKGNESE